MFSTILEYKAWSLNLETSWIIKVDPKIKKIKLFILNSSHEMLQKN